MDGDARAAAERLRLLHELKTPLTVLSGRVQLWQRRGSRGVAPTAAELDALLGVVDRLEAAVRTFEAGAHDTGERYRAIVEQALDYAIFTTDAEGRIETWPPGACLIFGWTEDEVVGQPFAVTYTPEDRAAGVPEQELEQARAEGSAPNVRWHQAKDGGRVFVEGVARARLGPDGAFLGLTKVGQDATERRLAEGRRQKEEERARDELEARVAASTAEVRDLSRRLLLAHEEERRRLALELHDEVGQVLTGLGLQLGGGTEVGGERLETIRATFAELTEQVRELSMDLRPAALDAYGLLPALRWHLTRYEERTGIPVRLFAEGVNGRFPPEVEIAAYRIVQEALTNVARHAGAATATVYLHADESVLTVVVRDVGDGFAKGRVAPGSGLGGMRERAELLGGTLEVDAVPGEGVTVTAELPLEAPGARGGGGRRRCRVNGTRTGGPAVPRTDGAALATDKGAQVPTRWILVAGDEQPIADVLVALLGDEGYAVRDARDGAVALAMVERDPPDLLISNVAMHYVDGIRLALRVLERRDPIPVVLVSAQVAAVDLPGVVFVAKPFDLDHIVALVERLLDGAAGAGTAGDGG